jgi:hypothetical protein
LPIRLIATSDVNFTTTMIKSFLAKSQSVYSSFVLSSSILKNKKLSSLTFDSITRSANGRLKYRRPFYFSISLSVVL